MPFRISKLKNVRVQIVIVMTFLVVYVLATYIIVEKYYFIKSRSNTTSTETVKLDYVVVHLDLKGAPPRLAYLESILPMLKNHGVNGLLIEYEDMFPYEGSLKRLRAVNYYKKKELQSYLAAAVSSGFEIIPLIQTFGHLEFVLKHNEFGNLREDPNFADSICPSSIDSQQFLREMLKQVIRFHKKISPLNHIHVGCDEVFHLNKCNLCQNRNLTRAELLTSHLNFVIKTVQALSPDSSVLIWDDMFRAVKPIDSVNLIFTNTEAVYWDYTPNTHDDVHVNMYKYGRMFDNLWIATAFKGADGPAKILPNLTNRFYNHLHWLNFIFDYGTRKNLYNIKGIILTGWSRYQHEGALCEIFPVSIPSLILNLILIKKFTNGVVVQDMRHLDTYIDEHIRSSFESSLRCQNISKNILELFDSKTCDYAESDLYVVLQDLSNKKTVLNAIMFEHDYKNSLLKNDTYANVEAKVEYEYFDVIQTQMEMCSKIFHQLMGIESDVIGMLSEYYENFVILEFIRTKIRSLERAVDGLFAMWKHKGLIKENSSTSNTSIHTQNKSRK